MQYMLMQAAAVRIAAGRKRLYKDFATRRAKAIYHTLLALQHPGEAGVVPVVAIGGKGLSSKGQHQAGRAI